MAEHLEDVLALVAPAPVADLGLDDAVGGVLAADVASLLDSPAFDASAMDGYAVRSADLSGATPGAPVTLRLVADVPAGGNLGDGPSPRVGPGEAARIMTGAPVPAGADVVVPVEETSTGRFVAGGPRGATVTLPVGRSTTPRRAHVRRRAEDVRRGDVVLAAGSTLTARHVSVAASAGYATLPVHRRPRVAVLSTGSELVPAGEVPGPGCLPDSNSVLLAAAAREAGAVVVRRGGVGDTVAELAAALDDVLGAAWPDDAGSAAARPDLVVTTGGVSAGAFDVARELLGSAPDAPDAPDASDALDVPDPLAPGRSTGPAAGAVTDARVVAVGMQPGKPQGLARWRGVPWLALPGNPVSAFVSFELFVRPAIDRLRGVREPRRTLVTRAAGEGWASPVGREQLVLVRHTGLDDARVVPAGRHGDGGGPGSGSHRLSALVHADAVAVVPADVTAVVPGDSLQVFLLD